MFESSYFTVEEHVIIILCYIVATIICILASSLVWIVVLTRRHLQSPMNYLLLNMSLADIVSALSTYPFLFILDPTKISKSQTTSSNLCIVTEGLSPFFIASATSLLTLCAISFNRFLAIKYPTSQSLRMGRRSVLIFSLIAWLIALIWMLPGMISFKWDNNFKICARDWGSIHSLSYRLAIMLFGLILPMSFLILSFSAIYFKAKELLPFEERTNARAFWHRRTRIRKAERTLGLLILVYIICWFPFILYWLIYSVSNYFPQDTLEGTQNSQRWLRVTTFFCTLNGTLNPFVYTMGSNDLKKDMVQVAGGIWRKLTCRKAFPVHPISLRTLSMRSNNTVSSKKNLSTKGTQQTVVVDDLIDGCSSFKK